jgi:3',5'-cyclic AMP phosphodiesterase CpdA
VSDTRLGFTDSRNRWRKAEQRGIPEAEIERHYSTIDKDYYELAVAKINQLAPEPDAVLITGDLVDSPDSQEQWEDYLRITKSIEFPVYEVMGNHDGFSEKGLDY